MHPFKILTVGWEPYFINDVLVPIEKANSIDFTHGLVGDAARVPHAHAKYPWLKFVALSKAREEPLPAPDDALLASLESVGVPTVKSMVRGDQVLRYRPEDEALGYATLLARRLRAALEGLRPDLVLGSHDSLHAAMSLAVAKSLGIPWVAMAFTVIPDDLTGFCYALTPNSLVPLTQPVDDELRSRARTLIENVRAKKQQVVAYRAPNSLAQWVRQYLLHAKNLLRRSQEAAILGSDRYTYPTAGKRMRDIMRRSYNRFRLPVGRLLASPPESRFGYFPLHMAPESMLDTWAPFYQDQLAFIAQVLLAIPADMTFVVKLHFSDPDNYSRRQLEALMALPRLRIAHPNASGNDFMKKAALIIGIQGTTCLEAALHGKPVLLFGDSPYQHFPRSERAKRPDELHEQIRQMLERPAPDDEEIVEAYAAYMARYLPGRINDWSRPIEPDEMLRLVDCFRMLRLHLDEPRNRAEWYKRRPFTDYACTA